MKSCFFIGHRLAPLALQEKLNETVDLLIRKYDVTEFIVGYHGDFDAMATAAVQEAKKCYYDKINALRLLCYHPAEHRVYLPPYFDELYYPLELWDIPERYAIEKANQIIVDHCDYLVAYVQRDGGNAAKIYRRAKRYEKKGYMKVINLAENTPTL